MTREQILRSMECVLESDKRTIKNPISEYGWLFDKIYEWKKSLEQEPCEKYIKEIDYLRKYISKLETQIVEKENADGCCSCAFEDVEEWKMPCSKCKRGCKDYWRPKKEN